MNDRNLDQLLDAWLDLGPDAAPDRVHAAVALEVHATRQTERFPPMNSFAKFAIAVAGVLVVAVVGIYLLSASGGLGSNGPAVSRSPSPSPAVVSQNVHGWPGARSNPPGLYSWDIGDDRGMHKPGDNDRGVVITFSASANAYESGPTPVKVAGYGGTYQKLSLGSDGTTEVWIVEMEGTRVTIMVQALRTTTVGQLAEAYAIIESIRREPAVDGPGYRLIFALTAGWDSG